MFGPDSLSSVPLIGMLMGNLSPVEEVGLEPSDDIKRALAIVDSLEHTQRWSDAFFHQGPVVKFTKDYSSGEGLMVSISDAHVEAFGIKRDEYAGRKDSDFFPADVCERFEKQDREVMDSGEPKVFYDEAPDPSKEGIWLKGATLKYPLYDDAGEVKGIAAIAWKIE